MDFNERQQEIIVNSYLLSLEGKGQVLTDESLPDAHWLAEAGWLDRKVEGNGDVSWWWSDKAETALRLSELLDEPSPN